MGNKHPKLNFVIIYWGTREIGEQVSYPIDIHRYVVPRFLKTVPHFGV